MKLAQPSIMKLSDGYNFMWLPGDAKGTEDWLDIDLRQIVITSGHNITAEITVMILLGERNTLEAIRFNLMSARDRRDIAVRLHELYIGIEVNDWLQVIDQVSTETIRLTRQATPSVFINEIPERETPRYQIHPIIFEGEANMLYGDGGIGKSTLAALIAVLVQDNVSALNLTPAAGNVLYLDWEGTAADFKEQVVAIRKGLGIEHGQDEQEILYMYCPGRLIDHIQDIQAVVSKHNISLIIIDSVGMATGGESDKSEAAVAYFNALRALEVTTLSIDHLSKTSDGKTPIGSIFKRNIPRAVYLIRKQQEPGESELSIGIYQTKGNRRLIRPFGYTLNFYTNGDGNTESILFNTVDLSSIPELAKGLTQKEQIKAVLLHGAIDIQTISEATGILSGSVKAVLYRHKDIFVHTGKGSWGLLSNALE